MPITGASQQWQYQERSDPLPIIIPSVDGWLVGCDPPVTNWQKAALYSVAALAPFFFAAPPEVVTVDKWYTQDQLRPPSKSSLHASRQLATFDDPFLLTQPEVTTPDRYRVEYASGVDRLLRQPHLQPSSFDDPFLLTQPEVTSIDRYGVEYPSAISRTNRQPHLSPSSFFDETPIVVADLGHIGWYTQDATRPPSKLSLHPSRQLFTFDDPFLLTQPEVTSPDRHRLEYPVSISRLLRQPSLQPSTFFDETPVFIAPVIEIDKWLSYPFQLSLVRKPIPIINLLHHGFPFTPSPTLNPNDYDHPIVLLAKIVRTPTPIVLTTYYPPANL